MDERLKLQMSAPMNIERESEQAKWLNLAYETYGRDGTFEMARALGLPVPKMASHRTSNRKRVGPPNGTWTTTEGSDINQTWREPVRMPAICPTRKPIEYSRWKRYEGDPRWFHCGYEGFLENRRPTRSQPVAECFYDQQGRLVDHQHPYAGCTGTPDQYQAEEWGHIWARRGWRG